MTAPAAQTTWRPQVPVDVRRTLSPLSRGGGDPTHRTADDGSLWRTSWTQDGPASYRLEQRGLHEVRCAAWGPGAQRIVAGLPDLLGARDTAEGFEPGHPLLAEAHARHPGLRVPRTGRVVEALVPAVLEQKVTGKEARSAFRTLVLQHGTPAPGPAPEGMRVPPPAEVWRRVPSWDWHRAGVDPKRSRTVCEAVRVAGRLEETVGMPREQASLRLQAVPGIGPWTVAEIAARALGDTDALSVGDYHLSQYVGWALLGPPARRRRDGGAARALAAAPLPRRAAAAVQPDGREAAVRAADDGPGPPPALARGRCLPAAQSGGRETGQQLAGWHGLRPQGEQLLPQPGRHVVVVALEGPRRDAELLREGVQLVVRHVADQVRPELAAPRPHRRVDQDGHRCSTTSAASRGVLSAGSAAA